MNGAGSCECTQWLGFIGKHKSIFTAWRIDHYTTTPCTWPLTGCGKAGAVAEGRACRAPPSSLHATASVSTDKVKPSCHSLRVDRQGQAFMPQRACRHTRPSLHATASVSTDKACPTQCTRGTLAVSCAPYWWGFTDFITVRSGMTQDVDWALTTKELHRP